MGNILLVYDLQALKGIKNVAIIGAGIGGLATAIALYILLNSLFSSNKELSLFGNI